MSLTLTYSQSTGLITSPEGEAVAQGWAGHGEGKNNPAMQDCIGVGPLPQGLYRVGHWEKYHPGLGPLVSYLQQIEGETFGRSGFYIHGASSQHPGEESKGCIVIPREGRDKVHDLNPDFIRVVA